MSVLIARFLMLGPLTYIFPHGVLQVTFQLDRDAIIMNVVYRGLQGSPLNACLVLSIKRLKRQIILLG